MKTIKEKFSISDLLGSFYVEGGRGPATFDCWGLVMEVAKRAGIILPDIDITLDRDELIEKNRNINFVKIKRPEPFCLVLFRIINEENKIKWHVGIVLPGCRKFAHTTAKMGVNISDLKDRFWRLMLEGYYNYRCRN